jgi:hypothetical protein
MKLTKYASIALLAMMIFPSAGYAIYNPDRPVSNNPDEVSITSVEDGDYQEPEDIIRITGQERATEARANSKGKGAERKSAVAKAVEELLSIADRSEGIGHQVRVIAQEQRQSEERLEKSMEKMEKRGRAAKFFIGPDWAELKDMKQEMQQNTVRITNLQRVVNGMEDGEEKDQIGEQIRLLQEQNENLKSIAEEAGKGFSLFGWLLKMVHGA